jgi:hypothetical protein
MKNLPKNLRSSCPAVLLVLSLACTKANFVRITSDAEISGGADGSAEAGSGGAIGSGPDVIMTCDAAGWSPTCVPPDTPEICDPVCQSGGCNWCLEKCTYALVGGAAQPTCAGKDPSPAGVFQACGVNASGLGSQNDNCAPGSICLQPVNGGSPSVGYCFPLCHNLTDCAAGVACTERSLSAAGGTVNVCDPPYDVCGPDGTCCDPYAQPTSSCGQGRVCLLVSPDPSKHSRTVCELSSGDGKNGATCASAHDCLLGNTCVNNGCHRVCDPTTNLCPTGAACTARGSEYSFCPSD